MPPDRNRGWRRWLPLLVGLAVVVASLALWRALVLREEEQMVRNAALEARNLGNAIESALHGKVLTLGRFAARWSDDGGRSERQFRRESGRILRDLGGFEALTWVDASLFNRWVEPARVAEKAEGRPLPLEPRRAEAIEQARRTSAPAVSRTVELMHGAGKGLLAFVPVERNGAPDGYLLGVFQLERFISGVLEQQGSHGYSVSLYDQRALIWEHAVPGTRKIGKRTRAVTVDLEGTKLTLAVTPGPEVVDAERSPLPTVVLAAGFAFAILLALALRMTDLARAGAAEANAARLRLEAEGLERERMTVALHRSEGLYRTLASHLPEAGVLLFDRQHRYLLADGPLLPLLGVEKEEVEGKSLGCAVDRIEADQLRPLYASALAGTPASQEVSLAGRWCLVETVPIRNEAGEILAGMVLLQDISQRRQARQDLEAFAARLQRSNRELQDFAYIASHDLQEPLRKIQAFGDRLKMRYGAVLDEQGKDYLERMQGAAGRMRELLEGLLDFSRITTNARPFQRVDLAAVARQVLVDLEVRIDETRAQVELGELPTIDADPLQMRQLLQNLVGNALKFHEPGKPPVVRISAVVRDDGRCELSVADEGIGFDEKHLDKIFAVFQRLHGRAYEGSGVGLAICRKIAGRHGGDISARSAPGKGATFVVTLPLEQATEPATAAA